MQRSIKTYAWSVLRISLMALCCMITTNCSKTPPEEEVDFGKSIMKRRLDSAQAAYREGRSDDATAQLLLIISNPQSKYADLKACYHALGIAAWENDFEVAFAARWRYYHIDMVAGEAPLAKAIEEQDADNFLKNIEETSQMSWAKGSDIQTNFKKAGENNPWTLVSTGIIERIVDGNMEGAIRKYERSLSIGNFGDLMNAAIYYDMSIAHEKTGNIEAAIQDIRNFIDLIPSDVQGKTRLEELMKSDSETNHTPASDLKL